MAKFLAVFPAEVLFNPTINLKTGPNPKTWALIFMDGLSLSFEIVSGLPAVSNDLT